MTADTDLAIILNETNMHLVSTQFLKLKTNNSTTSVNNQNYFKFSENVQFHTDKRSDKRSNFTVQCHGCTKTYNKVDLCMRTRA